MGKLFVSQSQVGKEFLAVFIRRRVFNDELRTADNDRLSNLLAQANSSGSLPQEQLSELMKLRGEVGLGSVNK